MKRIQPLFFLILCSVFGPFSLGAGYQIQTSVKTIDRSKSSKQERPGGEVLLRSKDQMLEISIRRTSPTVPEKTDICWVVLVEDPSGRVETIEKGRAPVSAPVGIPQDVNSKTWSLDALEWNRNRPKGGSGSMEMSVKGIGVQVLAADGEVLAEKFSPSSARESLIKAFEQDDAKGDPKGQQEREFHPPRKKWF